MPGAVLALPGCAHPLGSAQAGRCPTGAHLSQVHCISTEFTLRKHGGEKGVPFRVQIDTFRENESGEYTEHLHSASCQIKVFKVPGSPSHLLTCPTCYWELQVPPIPSLVQVMGGCGHTWACL